MADTQGKFCWYELMTTDTGAARSFYATVVGWQTRPSPVPDIDYQLFGMEAGMPLAGLMPLPEQARREGVPPNWMGYVCVDDADAMAARVARLGGGIHVQPSDIPGIGRFSVVTDPQKAVFALFQPAGMPEGRVEGDPCAPGQVAWHELLAEDWQAVFPFYQELFGWEKAEAVDIGEMGVYQTFSVDGKTIGGMLSKPPQVPVTYWQYYFSVGDIDAAAGRVTAAAGEILCGPMQVPGGGWIVQARDPQGAVFALFGTRG